MVKQRCDRSHTVCSNLIPSRLWVHTAAHSHTRPLSSSLEERSHQATEVRSCNSLHFTKLIIKQTSIFPRVTPCPNQARQFPARKLVMYTETEYVALLSTEHILCLIYSIGCHFVWVGLSSTTPHNYNTVKSHSVVQHFHFQSGQKIT